MSDAEKAWEDRTHDWDEQDYFDDDPREAFMAGRASRDAEVEALHVTVAHLNGLQHEGLAGLKRQWQAEASERIAELEVEKLKAEWVASQAAIHRSEAENRAANLREERDNFLAIVNERHDAPLWRKIASQRLELARLNRAQFRHSADMHQLRAWFRERIAFDGGQARRELFELREEMEQLRAAEIRGEGQ